MITIHSGVLAELDRGGKKLHARTRVAQLGWNSRILIADKLRVVFCTRDSDGYQSIMRQGRGCPAIAKLPKARTLRPE